MHFPGIEMPGLNQPSLRDKGTEPGGLCHFVSRPRGTWPALGKPIQALLHLYCGSCFCVAVFNSAVIWSNGAENRICLPRLSATV